MNKIKKYKQIEEYQEVLTVRRKHRSINRQKNIKKHKQIEENTEDLRERTY